MKSEKSKKRKKDKKSTRSRRRMFWRIYIYGAFLVLGIIIAVMIVLFSMGSHPPHHGAPRRLAGLLYSEFGENPEETEHLKERLKTIQEIFDLDVALYRRDGVIVAAGGDNPPGPLASRAMKRFSRSRPVIHQGFRSKFTMAALLNPRSKDSAYLIFSMRGPHPYQSFLVVLVVILLVMAAMAFPMARTIAKPLEQLTVTARDLGKGDLKARARLNRKDEVGMLADTIDDMADQLQRRIDGEKELLANISHEIRTPLARIRVALELCSEDEGSDARELRSYLEGIREDIMELDTLVEDVLAVTRLDLAGAGGESAGLRLRRDKTTVQEMITEALSYLETRLDLGRLDLDLPDDPVELDVDRSLIRRVLSNLLENAFKYSSDDSRVKLAAGVDERGENNMVFVEIRDQGIGIDPDDIPKLFDPFYRTDKSRKRSTGGTGLGLTLCRKIINAHDGIIEAESGKEGGSVFRFRIPVVGEITQATLI